MLRLVSIAALLLAAPPALAQEAFIAIPPKPALAKPAAKPAKPRPAAAKPVSAKTAVAKPGASKGPAKSATAQGAKRKPTLPPPVLGDRDSRGDFGIRQVAAPDATRFIADWRAGTASQSTATQTVADKPLFVFIVFKGCTANADGKCDLVVDFAIHRPDGSVDDDHKGLAVWNRAAPEDATKLVLGDGALGFGTDGEGPFGDYRITAAVTDRVANVTLNTEQVLTVAPAIAPPLPADGPPAPADPPASAPGTESPAP